MQHDKNRLDIGAHIRSCQIQEARDLTMAGFNANRILRRLERARGGSHLSIDELNYITNHATQFEMENLAALQNTLGRPLSQNNAQKKGGYGK